MNTKLILIFLFLFSVISEMTYAQLFPNLGGQRTGTTSLQFLEQPLGDIIAFLEDRHGIEIQLDTAALDTAGVNKDTPATIDVEGIPLRNALNLMLEEIELAYTIRDEVLLITTSEGLSVVSTAPRRIASSRKL